MNLPLQPKFNSAPTTKHSGFHTDNTVSDAVIKVPISLVNKAYDKWVRPHLIKHWTTTPSSQRMPLITKPPSNPTEQKISLFQETIAWLDSKPIRSGAETKWMFWATKRIQDLKFPQEEVLL